MGVADACESIGTESAPPGGGEGAKECDLGGVAAITGSAAVGGVALTEEFVAVLAEGADALVACAMGDTAAAAVGLGGILPRLAVSLACLILTSGPPEDGPDENRFFNVPKNPRRDFLSFSVGVGVAV